MGLDQTAWTAIGALANCAYCLLTAGLLIFAIYQVIATRGEAKVTRTLAACERYDTSPIIDRAARRISKAYKDKSLSENATKYTFELITLFSYFDGIAIGIDRGHYDSEIVKDQLARVMSSLVESMPDKLELGDATTGRYKIEDFDRMMSLYRTWKV